MAKTRGNARLSLHKKIMQSSKEITEVLNQIYQSFQNRYKYWHGTCCEDMNKCFKNESLLKIEKNKTQNLIDIMNSIINVYKFDTEDIRRLKDASLKGLSEKSAFVKN